MEHNILGGELLLRASRGEGVHVALFPIKITVVPLFLKNKLKCSRLLSSHVPRNCAPSSLDPLKYSSVLPTISLIFHFNFRLLERGYLATNLRKYLSEEKFANRKTALQQRNKSARKKLLPFVTQYHPALPSL